jgi:hypothetical protein
VVAPNMELLVQTDRTRKSGGERVYNFS